MVATIITCYLLKSGRSPGTHRWGFFYSDPKSKLMLTTRLRFIEPQLASSVITRQRGSTEFMKSNTMATALSW